MNNNSFNLGTLLKYPLIEFNSNKNEKINNEIIINLKIDEDDLNKDIYILNNPYFHCGTYNEERKDFVFKEELDEKLISLKELNKLNNNKY